MVFPFSPERRPLLSSLNGGEKEKKGKRTCTSYSRRTQRFLILAREETKHCFLGEKKEDGTAGKRHRARQREKNIGQRAGRGGGKKKRGGWNW